MWDLIVSVTDHCLSFYFERPLFRDQRRKRFYFKRTEKQKNFRKHKSWIFENVGNKATHAMGTREESIARASKLGFIFICKVITIIGLTIIKRLKILLASVNSRSFNNVYD